MNNIIFLNKGFKCPPSCAFGKACMHNVTVADVVAEMESFWDGGCSTAAPSMSERKATILHKLVNSYVLNSLNTGGEFQFSVGDRVKGKEDRTICESAYLCIIGHPLSHLWKKSKSLVAKMSLDNSTSANPQDIHRLYDAIAQTKVPSEQRSRFKTDHAKLFIKYFAEFNADLSPNAGEEHLRVLPFETISQLFEEYTYQNISDHVDPDICAKKETFRTTWKAEHKEGLVKFSRGKGTFPTCDIGNNANDLLASNKTQKFTKRQREIIFSFKVCFRHFIILLVFALTFLVYACKQLHLKQQAAERTALEFKKRHALSSYEGGSPTHAVFFGDGMTIFAGKTPKYGKRLSKKDTSHFENRVFGLEVYCGPISGEILFHTDELVRGGANLVIEIQRRGL